MRFSLFQLLLLAVIVSLVCALCVSAVRDERMMRVADIATSSDGRFLAAEFDSGKITLWRRAESGRFEVLREVEPPQGFASFDFHSGIGFTRDALWRFGGATNGAMLIRHDLETGANQHRLRSALLSRFVTAKEGERIVRFSVMTQQFVVSEGGVTRKIPHSSVQSNRFFDISHDGRYLVTIDDFEAVKIYDLSVDPAAVAMRGETGIPNNATFVETAISPAGDLAAVSYTVDESHRVEIWERDSGRRLHTLDLPISDFDLGEAARVAFSPDRTSLLISRSLETTTVWSVANGKQTAEFDIVSKAAQWINESQVAVNGESQLLIVDASSGAELQLLWRDQTARKVTFFTLCLVGWGVVWGRSRRRFASEAEQPRPSAELPTTGARPEYLKSRLTATLTVAGVLSIAAAAPILGWPDSVGAAMLYFVVPAGFFICFALVALAIMFVNYRVLGSFRIEMRRAQKITNQTGRTIATDELFIWACGEPTSLETELTDFYQALRDRFRTTFDAEPSRRRLAFFLFDHEGAYREYIRIKMNAASVFVRGMGPHCVVCLPFARRQFAAPNTLLQFTACYFLMADYKKFWLPPWASTVAGHFLVGNCEDEEQMRACHLRLQRSAACGIDFPNVLRFDQQQGIAAILGDDSAEKSQQRTIQWDIIRSLGKFLFTADQSRRDTMVRLLRELKSPDQAESFWRELTGDGWDELFDQWRAWMHEQPAGLHSESELDSQTIAALDVVLKSGEAEVDPLSAITCLGACSRAAAREPLEQFLASRPSASLAEHARWALNLFPVENDQVEYNETTALGTLAVEPVVAELAEVQPAHRTAETATVAHAPLPPATMAEPREFATIRLLLFLGGVVGAIYFSAVLLITQWIWLPTIYLSLAVAILGCSVASARATHGVARVAILQMACIVNCDPVNAALGVVVCALLFGSPRVKAYRRQTAR